ncbi:hypothetical protein MRX96_020013 [Rhipicephalus microplus]
MCDWSLAMINHQERMATQLGTARGGLLRSTNHVRDRHPKPCPAWTAVLQWTFWTNTASRASTFVRSVLYSGKRLIFFSTTMRWLFPGCLRNSEHDVTSDEQVAALAISAVCLLLVMSPGKAAPRIPSDVRMSACCVTRFEGLYKAKKIYITGPRRHNLADMTSPGDFSALSECRCISRKCK